MARFYGGIHGSRGPATRLGTPRSGLHAFTNGWHLGCDISMLAGESTNGQDNDLCSITLTSGSGHGPSVRLGVFTRNDLEVMQKLPMIAIIRNAIEKERAK